MTEDNFKVVREAANLAWRLLGGDDSIEETLIAGRKALDAIELEMADLNEALLTHQKGVIRLRAALQRCHDSKAALSEIEQAAREVIAHEPQPFFMWPEGTKLLETLSTYDSLMESEKRT